VTETTQAVPPPEQKSGFRAWWDSKTPVQLSEYVIVAGGLTIAALGSIVLPDSFAHDLLTNVWWYGIAASSLIFLSAYGGMVSLAQVSLYGISAFVLGNAVTSGQVKGLHLGYDPWFGIVLAIVITTTIGLILGAVAARSAGIYFLMITLAFAVLTSVFFGSVTILSGFSGISGLELTAPSVIGSTVAHPDRLYYVGLVASVLVYLLIRYVVRTPFGVTLQGVRDDPVRMASLGYNVALHRTLAMGFGAFIASIAGIIYAWQFGHVDPTGTISISPVIDLLVIAVIGSLYSIEGAWVGALVFVVLQDYARDLPLVHYVGITQQRFETMIGVIFLVIVLLSPAGLIGIWSWIKEQVGRLFESDDPPAEASKG
jgi:branched-chain amino acid transport system permease protein